MAERLETVPLRVPKIDAGCAVCGGVGELRITKAEIGPKVTKFTGPAGVSACPTGRIGAFNAVFCVLKAGFCKLGVAFCDVSICAL